jgi:ATP/maltotriose-dependent transcriptional regulator MalT
LLAAYVDAWTALRYLFAGDLPAAIAHYDRAIDVLEEVGELGAALTARFQRAMAQTMSGDHAAGLRSCNTGIEISHQHGEQWNRAYSLWVRSLCHWHENRPDEAEGAARQALEIQASFQDGICIALGLLVLCWVAVRRGQAEPSRRLARAADVVWALIGTDVAAFGPGLAAEHRQWTPEFTADDGADLPRTKAAAVAEGLVYAQHESVQHGPAQHSTDVRWGLTKREAEVLPLLVLGRSNKAIADELFISIRTVEGHVRNILVKLGLTARAEVPAWHARNSGP